MGARARQNWFLCAAACGLHREQARRLSSNPKRISRRETRCTLKCGAGEKHPPSHRAGAFPINITTAHLSLQIQTRKTVMSRNYTGLYEAVPNPTLNTTLCVVQQRGTPSPPADACLSTCNRYLAITHTQRPTDVVIEFWPGPLANTTAGVPGVRVPSVGTCNCTAWVHSASFGQPNALGDKPIDTGKNVYVLQPDGAVGATIEECAFRFERRTPELPLLNGSPAAGLSAGAIAGIVVAVVAVVGVLGGAVFYVRRRSKK
ncbi:hypothetical protein HDU96_009229 [Phlyctochytrium bullatum]|nr:hypothetical protein HDU96_009229 [Phlyctochytrium bullatum]